MDDNNVPTNVGPELVKSHFLPNRDHKMKSKLLLFQVLTKKDKNSQAQKMIALMISCYTITRPP
jgi:hypothetical protein